MSELHRNRLDTCTLLCVVVYTFIGFIRKIAELNKFAEVVVATKILEWSIYLVLVYIIASKKYSLKAFLKIALIGAILLISYIKSGKSSFLAAYLFIVAVKGIPYKKIFKVQLKVIGGLTLLCVIKSFVDFLFNPAEILMKKSVGFEFGFGNANQAALVVWSIYTLWYAVYYKGNQKKVWATAFVTGMLVLVLMRSRTACISILMIPCIQWLLLKVKDKRSRLWPIMLGLFQPFLMGITYISAMNFTSARIWQVLDKLLTNRIFLNWYAFQHNPVTLLGRNVNFVETGVYNPVRNTYNITTTVDCSYTIALLMLGFVPTMLFMVAYYILVKKAWEKKDVVVLTLAIAFACYGFMEAQFVSIENNFPFLYILAAAPAVTNATKNKNVKQQITI